MSRPYEVSNSITEVFVQCNIIINFYHIQIVRLLVFFQFYFFYLFCNLFCEQFIFIYIHKKALIYLHKWVSKLWTWSKFAPWPKILIKSYKSLRETRPYKSFSGATQIIAIWNHWRVEVPIKIGYWWRHQKFQNCSIFGYWVCWNPNCCWTVPLQMIKQPTVKWVDIYSGSLPGL